ncbi:disulfide isomerase TigA [Pseudovirgaria hyperparasitica]|uniref:protein disulfide-isomerase n=1 Tax=Pseudovirgaria hyperparasitica TaxID=470096 RepID=A0A6A6WKK2_9PEZI|nr:disulfide isomerase TigA [Pseudovirgaria hyperparasitica]KAF2762724.1 disulfide isomerase TigA [Pseudovirgaria hyperparasitica]
MVALTYLLTALPLVIRTVAASDVVELLPNTFDDIVLKSGKPALVEFFAPWCGHCKNLAPIYEELGTAFKAGDKVTIAKVDADAHKDLGKRFGIQGFPTLKWFDGKSDSPEDYNGGRDLESLTQFVTEKSGAKAKGPKQEPSNVKILTDKSFAETIGTNNVLVAFTAPWCGHCKNLAPTWEKLANTFEAESNVTIAKVDAEAENSKATASKQGVKSYPTIKFFAKGSTDAQDYTGGRSEEDFVIYLNAKAGTHRVAGGGLDVYAGTIKALDELAAEWVLKPGSDALNALTQAAQDAGDISAEYYQKVASKLTKDETFAEKEYKRLQGLLEKGGLSTKKLDDITKRSNVLKKFQKKLEEIKDEL